MSIQYVDGNNIRISDLKENRIYSIWDDGGYCDLRLFARSENFLWCCSGWESASGNITTVDGDEAQYMSMELSRMDLAVTLNNAMCRFLDWYDQFMDQNRENPEGFGVFESRVSFNTLLKSETERETVDRELRGRYPEEKPVCFNYATARADVLGFAKENMALRAQADYYKDESAGIQDSAISLTNRLSAALEENKRLQDEILYLEKRNSAWEEGLNPDAAEKFSECAGDMLDKVDHLIGALDDRAKQKADVLHMVSQYLRDNGFESAGKAVDSHYEL